MVINLLKLGVRGRRRGELDGGTPLNGEPRFPSTAVPAINTGFKTLRTAETTATYAPTIHL
jgi:hypothetical protein